MGDGASGRMPGCSKEHALKKNGVCQGPRPNSLRPRIRSLFCIVRQCARGSGAMIVWARGGISETEAFLRLVPCRRGGGYAPRCAGSCRGVDWRIPMDRLPRGTVRHRAVCAGRDLASSGRDAWYRNRPRDMGALRIFRRRLAPTFATAETCARACRGDLHSTRIVGVTFAVTGESLIGFRCVCGLQHRCSFSSWDLVMGWACTICFDRVESSSPSSFQQVVPPRSGAR